MSKRPTKEEILNLAKNDSVQVVSEAPTKSDVDPTLTPKNAKVDHTPDEPLKVPETFEAKAEKVKNTIKIKDGTNKLPDKIVNKPDPFKRNPGNRVPLKLDPIKTKGE